MRLALELAEPDLALELPPRSGPRPHSSPSLPHVQLDQWPPAKIAENLVSRCLTLPNVRSRESRMASAECRALSLPDEFALGPPNAFIDGHEFCHLHPLPEGSIHLMMPKGTREPAVQLGWAERHPLSRAGFLPDTLVMLYAPRDSMELGIVLRLVWSSYQFARGVLRGEPRG